MGINVRDMNPIKYFGLSVVCLETWILMYEILTMMSLSSIRKSHFMHMLSTQILWIPIKDYCLSSRRTRAVILLYLYFYHFNRQ